MSGQEANTQSSDKVSLQTAFADKEAKVASDAKGDEKDPALIKYLKVAAAAVTIVATISTGVIAIMNGWISFFEPDDDVEEPATTQAVSGRTTNIVKSSTATSFECIDLVPLMPNVIPHYLLNSIGSENFPYWLRIEGENKCEKKWRVVVSFEPEQNVVLKNQKTEIEIDHHAKFGETITPDFILPKKFVEKISISWSIFEEVSEEKLIGNSIKANVLPPYTVSFNLKKPLDRELDEGYILASLGAWTRRRLGPASELGTKCRIHKDGESRLIEVSALRSCYAQLFSDEAGSNAVSVLERHIEFPTRTILRIAPPSDLLTEKDANSLEAALLLMAVYDVARDNATEFELVLVISNDETVSSRRNKRVYVAWNSGRSWQALNMMKAEKLDFDDNVAQSSTEIGQIFSDDPSLIQKIHKQGVGYSNEGDVAVAEFHVAREQFGIQGLP